MLKIALILLIFMPHIAHAGIVFNLNGTRTYTAEQEEMIEFFKEHGVILGGILHPTVAGWFKSKGYIPKTQDERDVFNALIGIENQMPEYYKFLEILNGISATNGSSMHSGSYPIR